MVRRLQFLIGATALLVAAFSTGLPFMFYVVYLGLLAVGGSYVLTRFGLVGLEAGYRVDHLQGHVGEDLRTTYSISNTGSGRGRNEPGSRSCLSRAGEHSASTRRSSARAIRSGSSKRRRRWAVQRN